jgi:hypothetical protein
VKWPSADCRPKNAQDRRRFAQDTRALIRQVNAASFNARFPNKIKLGDYNSDYSRYGR